VCLVEQVGSFCEFLSDVTKEEEHVFLGFEGLCQGGEVRLCGVARLFCGVFSGNGRCGAGEDGVVECVKFGLESRVAVCVGLNGGAMLLCFDF
jgi:hypothetical protein